MMSKIKNIIASHLAIANENPEMSPNPSTAATTATIKKIIAKPNQPPRPFLFIIISIIQRSLYSKAVWPHTLIYLSD